MFHSLFFLCFHLHIYLHCSVHCANAYICIYFVTALTFFCYFAIAAWAAVIATHTHTPIFFILFTLSLFFLFFLFCYFALMMLMLLVTFFIRSPLLIKFCHSLCHIITFEYVFINVLEIVIIPSDADKYASFCDEKICWFTQKWNKDTSCLKL